MYTVNIFLLGLCVFFKNKDIKLPVAVLDIQIHISVVYKSQKSSETCVA